MKIASALTLACAAYLFALGPAWAAEGAPGASPPPELKPQVTCPISGLPADQHFCVDVKGERVYACSPACQAAIAAAPEEALAELRALGEKPAAAPKPQDLCPVMGGKINKQVFVDVKGYRVYACCRGCPAAIKAEPDKYLAKIRERGEEPEALPAAPPAPAPPAKPPAGESRRWTCPMHPKINQPGPGRCPLCGMALIEGQEGHKGHEGHGTMQ